MAVTPSGDLVQAFWAVRELAPRQCIHWQLGPLAQWLVNHEGEWRLATERDPEQEERIRVPAPAERPDAERWQRWAVPANLTALRLEAAMPDRPVIVRPDTPLFLPPGQDATFFVGIPVSVRIRLGREGGLDLACTPSVVLSNSWFGGPTEGELCYALRTTARRRLEELHVRPYRAVCQLQLRNRSHELLDFQRLMLRTDFLHVYAGAKHLWTNTARVIYRGEQDWSRTVFSKSAPDWEAETPRIGEARRRERSGLLYKTFDNLKAFAED